MTIQDAKAFVAEHHRHSNPPKGALFAAGVASPAGLCGVAIMGRPMARALQDGATAEIVRLATDGTYNACSKLYGAMIQAARALGYRRVYTYTLTKESGASPRAAGFCLDAELPPRKTWSSPSRLRVQTDLFGNEARPAEAKYRWLWSRS